MRGLLRWIGSVAAFYILALGVWMVIEPVYLAGLRGALLSLRSVGLVPSVLEPVAVPGSGLAVLMPAGDGLSVPQRILGADIALTIALVVGTSWLPWKRRVAGLVAATSFVFAAHVATILAQYWSGVGPPGSGRAAWNLWTTLYQGKVVPLLAWALFLACSGRAGRQANRGRGRARLFT